MQNAKRKTQNAKWACALVVLATLCATTSAEEPAKPVIALNGHNFTLPPGFDIELAANAPLVNRPITADFDEQGRLYVSDSSGSNDKLTKQLEDKPHRVVRLEDSDGDGRFDRTTVFADKLMFPEGTMWYDGSLYVAAPPSIWKFTDTDGDGVADRREEWFKGKTLTGCGNDLHGPYLGPDGWIYWCKGAFAEQTYERPGRPPLVTKASHILRCRPDGSGLEPVMTGGMDNPVDVVFTPGGERIFTTTFLIQPGGGLRDGLIHAVYGGVYGKVQAVLNGHTRTSPEVMPVLAHLGPAAPAGLTRYESDVFGAEYQDNLFAALFNMRKVTRHVLSEDGATFASRNEDFVVSDNLDFHATDVLEDADGSLLIVDTGGWYKLCCPTSQLVKPDILGAIYRVRRRDAKRVEDPRGLSLSWRKEVLLDLLDDPRPAVRRRAIHEVARLGDEVVPALGMFASLDSAVAKAGRSSADDPVRKPVAAIWALTRIETPEARKAIRMALGHRDAAVRHAAIHAASLLRDRDAREALIGNLLSDHSLMERRAAAEAIGRLGSPLGIDPLLRAIDKLPAIATTSGDRVLEHSLIYALIEIAHPDTTAVGLKSENPVMQRAAIVALDQMFDGGLTALTVTPFLSANDPELRRIAGWIAGRHPEWADALADYLAGRLKDERLSADARSALASQLGGFVQSPKIQELLTARLSDKTASAEERQTVLAAMIQSPLKEVPAAWSQTLAKIIDAEEGALVSEAIVAIRLMSFGKTPAPALDKALIAWAARPKLTDARRLQALTAVPSGLQNVPAATFDLLIGQLHPDAEATDRAAAVEILSKAKLSSEQLAALSAKLSLVGPLEIDRLLAAFEKTTAERVGLKLVADLDEPGVLAALRVETLKPRLQKYPAAVQAEAEKLYQKLSAAMAGQRAKLDELAESLPPGDVRRGQAIFNSAKAACATCHAIGYLGGRVGPDLTRIGQVRQQRDLLESIVFPSASFVRSYEPVTVLTGDGLTHNGLLRKDAADEVVLVKSAIEEIRIPRDNVEEMLPGTVSIMPQGLDKQLNAQDLADLVAFLQGSR